METKTKTPVMIYTEATPNPNTLKFVTNKALLVNDAVEFQSIEDTTDAPLANALFGFEGVENVFVSNNFVSISKSDDLLWAEIMIPIKDFLKKFIEEGKEIITENYVKPSKTATNTIHADDGDLEIRIKGALDKYVKPAVEMDGGNISFVKFENGVLTLQLQGSCSGCPSSTVTLKQGIENLMKRFVPEVQEVIAENA
ncbi:MAG TPA: NifU family protein [Chitinophagales bacterium]|jgi:Fe-S cluster biogenesis protein NfuA|nr:NifU family protein [Chitinophagales bacterium]MBP6155009.1 NifU family protein [Chitinophagales bacterium]HQV77124.1 NifU family protein [Chitinophagales bacterium]HQW77810.1 NifU family protein [Chitinophagales bacterium]HRB18635.1 NifU family protein [Chitinophagales bacterium]